jgi:HSP20 family protein
MARSFWDESTDIDRPVTDLFRPLMRPWGLLPWRTWTAGQPLAPTTDVFERGGDLVVRMDLPGIDPEKDVKVSLEEGYLAVSGERREQKEIKEQGYYRRESAYGSFERHIPVPNETKSSDVKAEYKDGMLEVVIVHGAKAAIKAEAKAIPVKTAKAIKV